MNLLSALQPTRPEILEAIALQRKPAPVNIAPRGIYAPTRKAYALLQPGVWYGTRDMAALWGCTPRQVRNVRISLESHDLIETRHDRRGKSRLVFIRRKEAQ